MRRDNTYVTKRAVGLAVSGNAGKGRSKYLDGRVKEE